jgi:hypothetical protein
VWAHRGPYLSAAVRAGWKDPRRAKHRRPFINGHRLGWRRLCGFKEQRRLRGWRWGRGKRGRLWCQPRRAKHQRLLVWGRLVDFAAVPLLLQLLLR